MIPKSFLAVFHKKLGKGKRADGFLTAFLQRFPTFLRYFVRMKGSFGGDVTYPEMQTDGNYAN